MPHPDNLRLFVIIISFILLLGLIQRPVCGLISYLSIMMLRPGLFFPVLAKFRIELIVGLLLILFIFSTGRSARLRPSEDKICKLMFILFAVMAVSMLQAMDFSTSLARMTEFLKVFLFFIMVVTLPESMDDIEILLLAFGFLTFVIAYDGIYNYLHGTLVKAIGEFRIDYAVASKGMGSGHVGLANMTLQGMPFIWYIGVYGKKGITKLISIILFCACLFCVIISGSRGGFAGLVALWGCMLFFSQKRFYMILAGILAFLSVPFFSASGYMNYISSILSFGGSDVSGSSRISGLRNGFEMMLRRPFLGVGPGCYPIARKAWFGWGLWSHNLYGEIMGDLGVTGSVVFFLFVKNYLSKAWQYIKEFGEDNKTKNIFYAIITATIVRLVLGMGTHSLYIFFWYMLAGIMSVYSSRILHQRPLKTKSSEVPF
jgi:O-Antigen ligase